MKFLNIHYLKSSGLIAAFVFTLLMPGQSQAGPITITPGWDLLHTVSATLSADINGVQYRNVSFESVPFGVVDISNLNGVLNPAPIGTYNYRNTDTIVYRSMDIVPIAPPVPGAVTIQNSGPYPTLINSGDSFTTQIQMTAMELFSSSTGLYATTNASKPSTGTMTITYNGTSGGTFSSYLDIWIQLSSTNPYNDPNAQTVSIEKIFRSNGTWSTTCPTCLILSGVNDDHFYTSGLTLEDTGETPEGRSIHVVKPVPEPATLALLTLGLGLLGFHSRKTTFSTNMLPA